MEEKTCYCFLDTNIFLHYHTITDINWIEELGAEHIVLVICSTVIGELDKIKNFNDNKKFRERARKAIAKLEEIDCGNKQVRPNVELLLIEGKADFDWESNNLDQNINDDRIIATILGSEIYNQNLVLVAHDYGLRLKAKSRNIKCHILPEKCLEPSVKTPEEEELERLRKENALLKSSLPSLVLEVILENGNSGNHRNFSLKKYEPLTEEEIEANIRNNVVKYAYKPQKPLMVMGRDMSKILSDLGPEIDVESYNRNVDEYIEQLRAYYNETNIYRDMLSRTIELTFLLINKGTAPAEDVDMFLYFLDDFEVMDKNDLPKPPKQPNKPKLAKSSILGDFSVLRPQMPQIPQIEDMLFNPTIRKINSYEVRYDVRSIKHGMQQEFKPVYIIFPSLESAKSFSIDYSIIAGNHPKKFERQINISVEVCE